MPEQLWFTAFLNHHLAGPVTAMLREFHVAPKYPQAPITNAVAMEVLVFAFLVLMFALVRMQLSAENPRGLQHIFEGIHGFIQGQSNDIIGHHSERFTPFLVSLGLFILISNLLGLIPGFESPTAVPVVPLGCAVLAFFYYQAQGFRKNGIGYLKHFLGPIPWLAPVMVIVEVFSHLARVLSLTARLYANIFAGDMVIWVWFSLVPLGVPIIFLGLHTFVSFLQAYIFVLLTIAYLAGAVAEEH
jgi:F-type H+-transporting ATPase subunit a